MPDLDERFRSLGRTHSPDLWPDIASREPRRLAPERPSRARRAIAMVVAFAVAVTGVVVVVREFHGEHAPRPVATGPTPSPTGAQRVCFKSEVRGDFDGDGTTDFVTLEAVLPASANCFPPLSSRDIQLLSNAFQLRVSLASGEFTQRIPHCWPCALQGPSDFNGDGRAELVISVGPGEAISYSRIYQLVGRRMLPIRVAPSDLKGALPPGPIVLGGNNDSSAQSSFGCKIRPDGSRVLITWGAISDNHNPHLWHVDRTTLALRGGVFVVVAVKALSFTWKTFPLPFISHHLCP